MGLVPLQEEETGDPPASLSLPLSEHTSAKGHVRAHAKNLTTGIPNSGVQPPEPREMNICQLSHPISGNWLQQHKLRREASREGQTQARPPSPCS